MRKPLMLISVLYLSSSMFDPATADRDVRALVARCEPRNEARGISGALIFTGTRFAQVVEGSSEAVDALLSRLREDARHSNLIILDRHPLAARRFAGWSMAYSGPSQFVARHVDRLLDDLSPAEGRRAATRLIDLLQQFTTTPSA